MNFVFDFVLGLPPWATLVLGLAVGVIISETCHLIERDTREH